MDTFLRPKSLKALDKEIERLLSQLANTDPVKEDYVKISNNLKELTEARSKYDRAALSPDMVVGIVANIAMILIVLNFEKTGVITSKAFSFLGRR